MENEKLIAFMNLKGISRRQLSESCQIPASTLNRIIKGEIQKVKMIQMEAIAKALGTTVYSLFDVPLEAAVSSEIKPEEAGAIVEKMLKPDESLLLYYYQNSFQDGKAAIVTRAKTEYYQTQSYIMNKGELEYKPSAGPDREYGQISLDFEQ